MNVGGVLEGVVVSGNKKSKGTKGEEPIDFGAILGQLIIDTNESTNKVSELINGESLSLEDINFTNMSPNMESVIKEFFSTTVSKDNLDNKETSNTLGSMKNLNLKESLKIKTIEIPEGLDESLGDLTNGDLNESKDDFTRKILSLLNKEDKNFLDTKDIGGILKEVTFNSSKDHGELLTSLNSNKNVIVKEVNEENLISPEIDINRKNEIDNKLLNISDKNIELGDVEKYFKEEVNNDEDMDFKEVLVKNEKIILNNTPDDTKAVTGDKNSIKINNKEIINDSIASKIIDLKEGEKSTLKVLLSPKELGEVEIKLELKNGVIKGNILVENSDIRHQLQKQMDGLKLDLKSKNINIENLDVNVNHDSQGQNNPRSFNRRQHNDNFYRFKDSNKLNDSENSTLGLRGYNSTMKGNSSLNLYV